MHIVFVVSDLNKKNGGKAHAALAYARALREVGADISIICTNIDSYCYNEIVEGQGVKPSKIHNISLSNIFSAIFMFRLLRLIKRKDYNFHVHGVFDWLSSIFLVLVAGNYYVSPHGMLNRYGFNQSLKKKLFYFYFLRKFYSKSSGFIYTSRCELDETSSNISLQQKNCIIPIPVSFTADNTYKKTRKTKVERDINFNKGDVFHIATIGRIDPVKNIESLLRAIVPHKNVYLSIAGDGNPIYVKALKNLACELNVGHRVVWHGFINDLDKQKLYSDIDVYVQASWSESFGLAALEAASAGVPLLCSSGVAIADELCAMDACRICEPSADALSEAIGAMCALRDCLAKKAVTSRSTVNRKFSSNAIGKSLLEFYIS